MKNWLVVRQGAEMKVSSTCDFQPLELGTCCNSGPAEENEQARQSSHNENGRRDDCQDHLLELDCQVEVITTTVDDGTECVIIGAGILHRGVTRKEKSRMAA